MFYIVSAAYDATKRNRDEAIERAAKRVPDGSGTYMATGERDISFTFRRRGAAYAAAKRIRKLGRVRSSVRELE